MFALDYRAWRMGPVVKEIYVDLADDSPNILKDYIRVVADERGKRIEPIRPFDDGEFSDRDLQLLDWFTEAKERASAAMLIDITHDPDSLWYKLVKENGLLESFENKKCNTSDLVLDLGKVVAHDPLKSRIYADHQEFLRAHRALQG
jgi:uncharacterized phage-associated protein